MKLPRISVRAVFLAVVVMAIDCAVVRAILARGEQAGMLLDDVACALPMAHALGFGFLMCIRGRRRAFWVGFEVAGAAALVVFLILAVTRRGWLAPVLGPPMNWLEAALSPWIDHNYELRNLWFYVQEYAAFPVLYALPQVAIALVGGLVASRLGPRTRIRLATALAFFAFFVLPAVAIEGYLRLAVDPHQVRLQPGSVAIVDSLGGLRATFEDGSDTYLQYETRVRVEDDSQRAYTSWPTSGPVLVFSDGRHPRPDIREVKVTILEGDKAGKTATLFRWYICPAR